MCPALKQQLKLGYPSGYLDLTQAYNVVLQGRLQASDSEQARNTFLVHTGFYDSYPSSLNFTVLVTNNKNFVANLLRV